MSDSGMPPTAPSAGHAYAEPPLKLLIVDDDPDVREALRLGLQACGLSTLVASTADAALELVRSNPDIGAVMTDIRMPGRSGIDLLADITHERTDPMALEVVVISGHGSLDQVAAAMRLGAMDFLAKPLRLQDAAAAARRALKRAAARRDRARRDAALKLKLAAAQATMEAWDALLPAAFQDSGAAAAWSGMMNLLSHELRTPLVPVLGYCELLRDSPADEAAAQFCIGEITRGAHGVLSAVERLEEFQRLSDPAVKPNRQRQPATALVAQAWQAALDKSAGMQVSLRLESAPGCEWDCDGRMLLSALGELLDNAIAQSSNGDAVEVVVRADEAGNYLGVRRQGPAWSGAVLTAAELTAPMGSHNGLGLSLSLVRRVARLHGGAMLLHNPDGGGALASLAWPAG
jgi:FixJ family two-component response regulator